MNGKHAIIRVYFLSSGGIKGERPCVYCNLNLRGLTEMKRLVSFIAFFSFLFNAVAQNGNEWIQYQQPYLKIPVARDGIYRISHDDLQQAGFPIVAPPASIQVFHRGVEHAIHVNGEGDGVFNPGDYIEFYGQQNDGAPDSTLYAQPTYQPHKLYNIFTDTTAYFLTYGGTAGKRMEAFAVTPQGIPESYHHAEKILILKQSYSPGVDYGNIQKTVFDQGEGWMGTQIIQGQEVSYSIQGITETVPTGGKPLLELLLTGRGAMPHKVEIYAGTRLLSTVSFQDYESYRHVQQLEWSDVDAGGGVVIRIRAVGVTGVDRVSTNYIKAFFPQRLTVSATETVFNVNANPMAPSHIRIENPPAGLRLFDVTNPSLVLKIEGQLTSGLDAMLPPSQGMHKIFATTGVLKPVGMKRIVFRQITPSLPDYVIITHRSLRKPSLGYTDPVKAYGEYRALPEGGGFDTLIVNIDQLYDQFNYGEASPRAIYQFMRYLSSTKAPEYLFLIGKGLDTNYGYLRNTPSFSTYKDLVPAAGYPASDMAYTAGLTGATLVHAVATGRLAANGPADVAAYLNKVKERDLSPYNTLRRKKILHLSGGIEESEPIVFRDILRGFEPTAKNIYFGAQVHAIAKQSTEAKLINIADEVNEGLGLITFFGHSAPNTLDFDIGRVTDPLMGYNNPQKYPFLLMNGCSAGSFFLNTSVPGENWINTPDKGAVGYIAHSSYGFLLGLQRYSSTFYEVAFSDSVFISKGVGDVQQEVTRRYFERYGTSPSAVTHAQQMVLLGDPAVKIFGAEKPDYAVDAGTLSVSSFQGKAVTAFTDSFRVNLPVRNFGIAKDKPIRISMTREFAGGEILQYDTIVPAVLFTDTISVIVRNKDRDGYGMNKFTIDVDADNIVDELDETNNTAVFGYFIPLNSTRNLYPYDFSIVNTRNVALTFQHTDALAPPREYVLELDTASTFDTPFKKQFSISAGMLVRQPVELLESDSLVYYWRTKLANPLADESKEWIASSFLYIDGGPEGWAQARFAQLTDNRLVGLVQDPEIKKLRFQETVTDIAIKTFSSTSGKPRDSVSLKINGAEFNLSHEGDACRDNTINLVAFDRKSTQPYAGIYFKWYELLYEYGGRRLLCGREPYVINSFTANELITGNQDDLSQYIDNVASGDSVILFNIGDAGYEQWPALARQKLSAFGISPAQLDILKNGDPVVIFGRKDSAPGTAQIYHVASPGVLVEVNRTIAGRFSSGSMKSVTIGPARRWDQFIPRVTEVEAQDDFSFTLLGIDREGGTDTLRADVISAQDLSSISAEDYRYVEIVYETRDDVDLTASQLSKWFVLYEPVAEGLTYYRGQTQSETVQEGQTVSRDYGFINISNKTFPDSLTVRFDLHNIAKPAPASSAMRIFPPLPGDTVVFSVPFNTIGKAGMNNAHVFVNPEILPEHNYDNNVITLQEHVNVLTDDMKPVIDVTFDGRHIFNDAFVSSNPDIVIRLWDENRFMPGIDTVSMRIFLSSNCQGEPCDFTRVYFSRNEIEWERGSDTSAFTTTFSPRGLQPGRYILRIEARDASGNAAGDDPYQIAFRVETGSTIVVGEPYPNPFAHQTTFNVTIPGDDINTYHSRLYITAMSGASVTVSNDSAPLHAGSNTLFWDGRSGNGQSLPAGIYFYRLVVTGVNEKIEHLGKIVLIR